MKAEAPKIFSYCVLAVLVLSAFLFVPFLTFAAYNALSYESIFRSTDNKTTILLPANWVSHEENTYTTVSGATVELLLLWDQADWGSRITRSGHVMRSTVSGIFRLPPSIAARLEPREIVNFYIHELLRSSIGGKVISAKVLERNGEKVYSVEWTYTATQYSDKLQFVALEEFIFRGDRVYWIHGEYATIRANARDTIFRMVQSFKADK